MQKQYAPALVMLVGPPGAGKSTFVRQHFLEDQIVNRDTIRWMLTGDEADQEATPAAVRIEMEIIRHRLYRGLLTVVDATNAEAAHRRELYSTACGYGAPLVAVVMHTPLEVCIARQERRKQPTKRCPNGRVVPTPVIMDMHAKVTAGWDVRRDTGAWTAVHIGPDETQAVRHGTIPPSLRDNTPPWLDVPEVASGWVPWMPPKPCLLCGADVPLSPTGRYLDHNDCRASGHGIDYVTMFLLGKGDREPVQYPGSRTGA